MINWISRIPQRPGGDPICVVDGGATHSRAAIAAPDGTLLGYAAGGPTNSRSVGNDRAAGNLASVVAAALADAGDPRSVGYCLVTSASVDTEVQSEVLSDAVRGVVPDAVVATVPDTMGCWASANDLGPAVAVIAGTGSVVVAADRERGLWRRFGGWDFLLGDEGSGYGIGRAALREALLVSEGRSDATALSRAVLASSMAAERGIAGVDDIPDAVHKPTIDKAWIASFAPLVLDLAEQGDAPSLALVRRETAVLADAAVAAVAALDASIAATAPVVVGLFGGTFRSEVLADAFADHVRAGAGHEVDIVIPDHSALVGAFTIALGWGAGDHGDRPLDRLMAAVAVRQANP